MSVKYGQVAEPLSLHCGAEPGFQSSSSGKKCSSAALFATFHQKKLADRNVCSRLLYLVFVIFTFSLRTRTKEDFINKAFRNAY